MIQKICKEIDFLQQKSEPASEEDLPVATDLLETLKSHREACVGMAANMIGIKKRIIAFENNGTYTVMFNPRILKKSGPYEAEEGCLSLPGIDVYKRQSQTSFPEFYPLIAPIITPFTKKRCKKGYTKRIGMVATIMVAYFTISLTGSLSIFPTEAVILSVLLATSISRRTS